MTRHYNRAHAAHADHAGDILDHRDEEVMQARVTAGALVALADGELDTAERAELVIFVDRQGFAPAASPDEIAAAFDSRVCELDTPSSINVIVDTLRPLAGRSLASVVMRTAERVAAADRKIHPGELHALKLIRRVMMNLPAGRPDSDTARPQSQRSASECRHCGAVLISPVWSVSAGAQETVTVWHCVICGHEFETTKQRATRETAQAELMRAFFPSLLVA